MNDSKGSPEPQSWHGGAHHPHRCPWWMGLLLISPFRRAFEDPDRLLVSVVAPGMRVLEVGPALGFYTIPLAKRVGARGRAICVEVAPRMRAGLKRRLQRHGLDELVEIRPCSSESLELQELQASVDGALLINVLHELDDPRRAIQEIRSALKSSGFVLFVEPRGHCSKKLWEAELTMIEAEGFQRRGELGFAAKGRYIAIFERTNSPG